MAQITGAVSSADVKIEVSTNGSTWTNVSGAAGTVEPSGGNKITSESYTFDGDDPIVTTGKNEPFEMKITAVYTEGASDLFEIARPVYESGGAFYVRYSPKGGATGDFQYTTAAGRLTDLTYPSTDASSADPIQTGITWRGARPTKSVVA